MKNPCRFIFLLTLFPFSFTAISQECADPASIDTLHFQGNRYELVKDNKTWPEAASCAMERGGYLAQIDSQDEQDSLYTLIVGLEIDETKTIAPDGGRASYIWLGGNDMGEEGRWIWDGDFDGSGPQFWQGTKSGYAVNGLYNNWGREPDNYNDQDALAMAITDWPLGKAGQWNDIKHTNSLFYLIEYTVQTGISANSEPAAHPGDYILLKNFPNPFNASTTICYKLDKRSWVRLCVHNAQGQIIETLVNENQGPAKVRIVWQAPETHASGIYLLTLQSDDHFSIHKMLLLK